MNPKNIKINVGLEIEKGDAALRQAEILLKNNEYDGAVSRAYYAVFHYAQALLFLKGIEARSHHALNRLFSLHFVRSGAFEKRFATILSHAQKAREESDYSPEIPFSSEEAQLRIDEAKDFIDRAGRYLSSPDAA
ncbi:MAG: HEPN domain-containing protein [bacterium]